MEERDFKIGHFGNFQTSLTLLDLDLDLDSGHTAYRRALLVGL